MIPWISGSTQRFTFQNPAENIVGDMIYDIWGEPTTYSEGSVSKHLPTYPCTGKKLLVDPSCAVVFFV